MEIVASSGNLSDLLAPRDLYGVRLKDNHCFIHPWVLTDGESCDVCKEHEKLYRAFLKEEYKDK